MNVITPIGTIATDSKEARTYLGFSPSGKAGFWVFKKKIRIYAMDNVLRYKHISDDEIDEIWRKM